ncbi:pseudouridine synthase [Schaalia naturae]|uniref:Pseudouridine synthase n=1 Tax=Schaalia naturae TaxID=635203 RepID=A0ABW2SKR4_9ACTO|nr:pseudouridine synthase [Actinomyces sp.]MCI1642033.1 rRNA pseudouridine synthase [Actinomyces sp.]MCI1691929.1 rRNA pseudouridine synthase [Actinomyces sp.]
MRNDPYVSGGIRLQKVLSQAGIASRRAAEQMIQDGRVAVDGQVVTVLGMRVDPERQAIHVDGERVILDETKHVVLAVNKPVGVVSTMSDPEGRESLTDLIGDYPERLYHVGRLDIDTSGLLLLTNDGELANRLTHPSYEIPKTYVARVHGEVKGGVRRQMLSGLELEDGPIAADAFRVVDTFGDITTVEITVHEGRNRIVRRMMDAVGFPVRELVRTQFGPIHLDHLQPGTTRRVKGNALTALYGAVGL